MSEQPTLQVVDKDGTYNTEGVAAFVRQTKIEYSGVGYQMVAIMGPQSSGKSTLMNSVFGTRFTEMDALSGRQQTTRGIWLAHSQKISEPKTMVLDLEGSDGRERGEDDTSFERQSALFALSAADVLLVNMWAKDIGRETGSGKPLLKTIFQVNLKLFTPAPGKRRTVLLFVFRDRTRTPLPRLIETWQEDLDRMWASITKPAHYEDTAVTDFFEVKYASLPNFEEREEDFRAESVLLRRRFTDEDEDSLVRVAEDKLPGAALPLSLQKLWEMIREQKDLNLPAHKVMVANIRCAEIAADQLQALLSDQAWVSLQQEAAVGLVPGFGERVSALLQGCLTGYDEEARYFEAAVRSEKRKELVSRAYGAVAGVRTAQLDQLRQNVLLQFQTDLHTAVSSGEQTFTASAAGLGIEALEGFEQSARDLEVAGSDWTAAEAHGQLEDDIAAHVRQLEQQKVAEVTKQAEARLSEAISGPAIALLDSGSADLWPRAARLHATATAAAQEAAAAGLAGYELSSDEWAAIRRQLDAAGRQQLETHVREAAHTALSRMKDSFNEVFSKDDQGMPRVWAPRVNIPGIAAQARTAAARLLALLAVVRLDLDPAAVAAVEESVVSLAGQQDRASMAGSMVSSASQDGNLSSADGGFDMLSASSWPEVPAAAVLLAPGQCRSLWRQFLSDSNFIVQQAMATQEANRAASNRMPPLWAAAAIVILGWNEFFAVLRNPLWLLLGIVLFLFGKTVYQDLEVDTEMQRGLLPGLVMLSGKFLPTLQAAFGRTLNSVAQFAAEAPGRAQETIASVRSPSPQKRQSNPSGNGGGTLRRRGESSGIEMTGSSFTSSHQTAVPHVHFDDAATESHKSK